MVRARDIKKGLHLIVLGNKNEQNDVFLVHEMQIFKRKFGQVKEY